MCAYGRKTCCPPPALWWRVLRSSSAVLWRRDAALGLHKLTVRAHAGCAEAFHQLLVDHSCFPELVVDHSCCHQLGSQVPFAKQNRRRRLEGLVTGSRQDQTAVQCARTPFTAIPLLHYTHGSHLQA